LEVNLLMHSKLTGLVALVGLVVSGFWVGTLPTRLDAWAALIAFLLPLAGTFGKAAKAERLPIRGIRSSMKVLLPVIAVLFSCLLFAKTMNRLDLSLLDGIATGRALDSLLLYCFVLALVGLVLVSWPRSPRIENLGAMPLPVAVPHQVVIIRNEVRPPEPKVKRNTLRLVGAEVIGSSHEIKRFRRVRLKEREDKIEANRFFPIITAKVKNVGSEPIQVHRIDLEVRRVTAALRRGDIVVSVGGDYGALLDFSLLLDPGKKVLHANLPVTGDIEPGETREFVLAFGQESGLQRLEPVEYSLALSLVSDCGPLDLGQHGISIAYPYEVSATGTGRVWLLQA
jgi:hypothetical protein